MATKSAIGRIASTALNDLADAMNTISQATGVEPLAIDQIRYNDPAYQEAMRLVSLADWAGRIATALVPTSTTDQAELIAQVEVPAEGELDVELPFETAVEPEAPSRKSKRR